MLGKHTKLVIVVTSLTVFLALVVAGVSLIVRFNQTNTLRQRQDRVWRVVLCDIEQQTLADKKTSLPDKIRAVQFYDGLLVKDIKTAPCGLKPPRR